MPDARSGKLVNASSPSLRHDDPLHVRILRKIGRINPRVLERLRYPYGMAGRFGARLGNVGASTRTIAACIFAVTIALAGCGRDSGSSGGLAPDNGSVTIQSAIPSPTPTPLACNNGSSFAIVNNNSYPVWLGESYQGASNTVVLPPNNDWKINANSNAEICMPSGWSGRFWPRTECDFAGMFGNDAGYQSCSTSADCTVNNSPGNPHICYGGRCMLTCNTGGTPFCQGSGGLNNNAAVCAPVTQSTKSPAPDVCTYPSGTVCKTGDCQGLYQCYGTWDGANTALISAAPPVSLFEATYTGISTVNYDTSQVNGYNTQIKVEPSIAASGATCYAPSCLSDLNSTCPSNLEYTEPPTSTPSSIPCGSGTYCESGECVNKTCVIGCWQPGDLCSLNPSAPGLNCTGALPSGATYQDMYLVKDTGSGVAMSSGNQGDSTCWADVDCPPGEKCEMAGRAGIPNNFPPGAGVCATKGAYASQQNCQTKADVGNGCGGYHGAGYPNALGYRCISTGSGNADVACVPAYNPPVSGLGVSESASGQPDLLTGVGSFINPEWLEAATHAGGGTKPYYEDYAAACPHHYGFSYDDIAGDFQCFGSGSNSVNFTITFGP